MFKLKLAEPKDIPSLKALWKLCFDDTDDFVDFFFDAIFQNIYPVGLFHFDKPVGMMYLFPVSVMKKNRMRKGFYVYAIGIHPEYRGKSIFQNSINEPLFQYLLDNDMFCILCPANEKLSEFYKKLNYKSMCSLYKTKLYPDDVTTFPSYRILNSEEMYEMRKECFRNCINWNTKELDLILKTICFSGGEALNIEINNNSYYCITEKSNNEITILESNIRSDSIQDLCNFICNRHKAKEVNFVCTDQKNNRKYIETLSFNLDSREYYFNFAMQ